MKFSHLDSLDLNPGVKIAVSSSLSKLVVGSSTIITTPLCRSKDPETILSEWDKVFNSLSHKLDSELIKLELSNRSKYGPRSLALPWVDRRDGVLSYFSPEKENLEEVRPLEINRAHLLRPISLANSVKFINTTSNSGLPFLTRKGSVIEEYLRDYDLLLQREDDCMLFTRTQEDLKTRTVWGYPMADILHEMMFYRPLLGFQKKLNWRSSLKGPEYVDDSITKLLLSNSGKSSFLSIDFSNFDATVKETLHRSSFDYIKKLYQSYYSNEIDIIQERFSTIGLITPDGVYNGVHGVPSGSAFTNEVDSISQYNIATSLGLRPHQFDIQGDDGAYTTKQPEAIMEGFSSYGLNVNEEKSFISNKSFVYLQNLFSLNYERNGKFAGIYPTYRALGRLIYPERYFDLNNLEIEGKDYFSIRALSILENVRNHPMFPDFVKFIYNLDKYNLSYSREGLLQYTKGAELRSDSQAMLRFRYGDNLSGINSFETVKVIKELGR